MTEQAIPQKFHIGTVLSITTDYLLHRPLPGEHCIDGVYQILNYMTGDNLFTHQLPRAATEVRSEINKQLPWTVSLEMSNDANRLAETLPLLTDQSAKDQFIDGFVAQMAAKYGEYHELTPVPFSVEHHDPIEELETMVGKDRIITVETP